MDRKIKYSWKGTDTRTATFEYEGESINIEWNVKTHGVFVCGTLFNIGDLSKDRATYPEFYSFVEEVYDNTEEFLGG